MKLHFVELKLASLRKGYLRRGRVDLVVGESLCLGLRSLEVSHLDLSLLKEEFLTVFSPYRGFVMVEHLQLVSLVLVIFMYI